MNGTNQGSLLVGYFLIGYFSLLVSYLIIIVIVRIFGYLHRDKIKSSEIPTDLPKKELTKTHMWIMIAVIGFYQAISALFTYFELP